MSAPNEAYVWVIEYFLDGQWHPYEAYMHLTSANAALHTHRRKDVDRSLWRRKKYVRDTTTPVGKGRAR